MRWQPSREVRRGLEFEEIVQRLRKLITTENQWCGIVIPPQSHHAIAHQYWGRPKLRGGSLVETKLYLNLSYKQNTKRVLYVKKTNLPITPCHYGHNSIIWPYPGHIHHKGVNKTRPRPPLTARALSLRNTKPRSLRPQGLYHWRVNKPDPGHFWPQGLFHA